MDGVEVKYVTNFVLHVENVKKYIWIIKTTPSHIMTPVSPHNMPRTNQNYPWKDIHRKNETCFRKTRTKLKRMKLMIFWKVVIKKSERNIKIIAQFPHHWTFFVILNFMQNFWHSNEKFNIVFFILFSFFVSFLGGAQVRTVGL